jgi:hypothetical protein
MSKLYIFGIGGTGSRVLKSLTMLMAAGVKVNTEAIVPVIIDPDHAAADLTRTVKLMRDYVKVRQKINFDTAGSNTFFNTDINLNIIPSVTMPVQQTQNVDFKTYIGLQSMNKANYALASMLFSDKNLNSKMDVGFKGNPNIGSVVLNQFAASPVFTNFAGSFQQGDRIFIISSIFGGTGASGFPLLLKNLRAISTAVAGNANVKDAPIGAVSVLPYFDVAPPEQGQTSEIDSSTFIAKTKAALSYYDKNLKEANTLYYVADKPFEQYPNSEGGTTQQNKAHFIELAAALAIVDFAAQPAQNFVTQNGVPQRTDYKEFGIRNTTSQIIFGDLDGRTNHTIKKPMTKFTLFCKYLNEQREDSFRTQPWAISSGFDDNFFHSSFYQSELTDVKDAYLEWLTEMSENERSFAPFHLPEKKTDVFSLIPGVTPARWFGKLASNYALFDDVLNAKRTKIRRDADKDDRFIELFHAATEQLVTKKFKM